MVVFVALNVNSCYLIDRTIEISVMVVFVAFNVELLFNRPNN